MPGGGRVLRVLAVLRLKHVALLWRCETLKSHVYATCTVHQEYPARTAVVGIVFNVPGINNDRNNKV